MFVKILVGFVLLTGISVLSTILLSGKQLEECHCHHEPRSGCSNCSCACPDSDDKKTNQ